MRLPVGVSSENFSRALEEFANVVGDDWVFANDEDVATYRDAYTPFVGEPELELVPGAAVAPSTVEQVREIVTIANKYKVPIFPISTGRNLTYGGSSPAMSGGVIVDLKRMNRILELNADEGYVVVEPGVSFIQLDRHLKENQVPYILSLPSPGWGSLIGNALDHGNGVLGSTGDNFGFLNGMEVVLPTGELIRTGMGAAPTSKLWHNFKYGYGPTIDGIFSQSNFGIVTKAGFWLVPRPEVEQLFSVTSWKTEDMQAIINVLLDMRNQGLVFLWAISSPIRESLNFQPDGRQPFGVPKVRELNRRRDGGSIEEWDQLGHETKIPVVRGDGWTRGPAGVVKATLEYARERFSKLTGLTFEERPAMRGENLPRAGLEGFGILAVQETNRGHMHFSPIVKPTAEDIFAFNDTIRNVMLDAGDVEMLDRYGWSSGIPAVFPKSMEIMIEFLVHDDAALNRRRRELWKKLAQACAEKGWAVYRAPTAFGNEASKQYGFNNNALWRFHETVKDAIDPNGILAPGTKGIWPKRLRTSA